MIRLEHQTGETLINLDNVTHIKYNSEGDGTLSINFVSGTYDHYSNVDYKDYEQLREDIGLVNEMTTKQDKDALLDIIYENKEK